jgi:hypothetical protein
MSLPLPDESGTSEFGVGLCAHEAGTRNPPHGNGDIRKMMIIFMDPLGTVWCISEG